MIMYNDDGIYVGYIKQLLHSFELPQCRVCDPKTLKTTRQVNAIWGNSVYSVNEDGSYRRVGDYKFGDAIPNLTKTFTIGSNVYDAHTHEYLGDYLRFVRDYVGIDLMGMYNCFSNNPTERALFNIQSGTTVVATFDSESTDYTVYAVPVKFGREYTIAIDWHGTIEMACAFYSNGNVIVPGDESTDPMWFSTYAKRSGCRFSNPFVYDKLAEYGKNSGVDHAMEGCLRLLIKVPNGCKSTIVVLEGDHTQDASTSLLTKDGIGLSGRMRLWLEPIMGGTKEAPEDTGKTGKVICSETGTSDYLYRTRRQLLAFNTETHPMLADRLVEYLSHVAVTPDDPITENITALQWYLVHDIVSIREANGLLDDGIAYVPKYRGVWDEGIRKALYRLVSDSGMNGKLFDVESYLDKDVETSFGGFETHPYEEDESTWLM